jgi:glycosyltransferase involved in cell wall biosynthesis
LETKNPIRVLFVTHYSEMYGANLSLLQLILELRENFHLKPIVLLRLKGSLCEELNKHQIPFIVSHYYWWVYEGKGLKKQLHSLLKIYRNRNRVKQIISLLENKDTIDLVYTNSITVNIGVSLSKYFGCGHIWHIRETLQAYEFKLALGKRVTRLFLKKAAEKYIVISNFVGRTYDRLIPAHKMIKIYNGIQIDDPLRNENIFHDTLNICLIGILSEQKNQMEALHALKYLKELEIRVTITIHLAGHHKVDYFHELEQYIESNDLTEDVFFHGHVKNVREFLDNMHIGVVCARDEGFGRVTAEYMLNRMPVIASNSGANPEIIQEGRNGYLYELYDSQQLAQRILHYIEDPQLLEKHGSYARQYAIENFSSAKNTKLIYQQIMECINKGSSKNTQL